MIKSFKDKDAEKIFHGFYVKRFDKNFHLKIRQKLKELDAAIEIGDLRVPRSNHLEKLTGKFREYWRISIKRGDKKYGGYRIIFKWENSSPYDLMILDYHK